MEEPWFEELSNIVVAYTLSPLMLLGETEVWYERVDCSLSPPKSIKELLFGAGGLTYGTLSASRRLLCGGFCSTRLFWMLMRSEGELSANCCP